MSWASDGEWAMASVYEPCAGGLLVVKGAAIASSTLAIEVANIGSTACTSGYKIAYYVLPA